MNAVVEQSLRLARPHLKPPLFSSDALAALHGAAEWLAPVARIGFECRLDAVHGPVDVSQLIELGAGDGRHLLEVARVRGAMGDDRSRSAWSRIERFADACAGGDLPVSAVWLEYDLDRGLSSSTVPALFANLTPACERGWRPLYAVLSRLGAAEGGSELEENLARCVNEAERMGGRARALCGVMLSRSNEARIMLIGLPSDALGDYLSSIGWRGDLAQVGAAIEVLRAGTADIALSLELAPALSPRAGLELRLDEPSTDAETRARVLDALLAAGLCSEAKRQALEAWSGQDTPGSVAGDWPESLLVDSLLRPADELGLFHRTLHHCKIAAGGPGPAIAKAYLGLLHSWWKPAMAGYAHVL